MPAVRPLLALFSATLLATACTTTATPPMSDAPPASGSPPAAASCDPAPAQRMLGQPATPANVEQARTLAGARTARVIPHGTMVTMEYMEGRLNIYTDERNVMTQIACG